MIIKNEWWAVEYDLISYGGSADWVVVLNIYRLEE